MGGRFPVGAHHISTDEGLTKYSFGDKGGEEKHTLSINEMPAHAHGYKKAKDAGSASGSADSHPDGPLESANTDFVGGGQSHENRPPYLAIYFIKKK
jgi:microcystin-dependent protein